MLNTNYPFTSSIYPHSIYNKKQIIYNGKHQERGHEIMIVIGICDGEQTVRSLLASYVERFREETGEEIQLLAYSTGEKLLKNYILKW